VTHRDRTPYSVSDYYSLRYYSVRTIVDSMGKRGTSTGLRRANDPPLLILTSLAEGPKHGYALAQDIGEFAGVELSPGALYGAITRLEERGLIESLPEVERRRPYRLTPEGTAALTDAMRDMRRVVSVGTTRLGLMRGRLA
jgi:DNA-binding PadR family transcriptional regulator